MDVRFLTLAIALLLAFLLCSASAGPVASADKGKELQGQGGSRKLVQQNPVKSPQTHRPPGWKKRRPPRPRLSHKGPMPF